MELAGVIDDPAVGRERVVDAENRMFEPAPLFDTEALHSFLDTEPGKGLVAMDPFWGQIAALYQRDPMVAREARPAWTIGGVVIVSALGLALVGLTVLRVMEGSGSIF